MANPIVDGNSETKRVAQREKYQEVREACSVAERNCETVDCHAKVWATVDEPHAAIAGRGAKPSPASVDHTGSQPRIMSESRCRAKFTFARCVSPLRAMLCTSTFNDVICGTHGNAARAVSKYRKCFSLHRLNLDCHRKVSKSRRLLVSHFTTLKEKQCKLIQLARRVLTSSPEKEGDSQGVCCYASWPFE